MSENNPFLSVSLLPYQAPRFDLTETRVIGSDILHRWRQRHR